MIIIGAFVFNRGFLTYDYSMESMLKMNDVGSILTGYHEVPNLLVDGIKWWHGEWIQDGIPAFRPVSSYLYWCESHLGLTYGFWWVSWIGLLLLGANCILSAVLAWQFTGSKVLALGAGILATTVRFHNPGHPDIWLAWYPVHQDLMMNALMLGAIASFYQWFQTAEKKWLPMCWVLYVLGILAKEHVYIFPLLAGVIVLLGWYRKSGKVPLKTAFAQVAMMLGFVIALSLYRAAVIEHPRNPSLKWNQFIYKPVIFLFPHFSGYLFQRILLENGKHQDIFMSKDSWMPGLSLILFLGISGAVIFRKKYGNYWWTSLPVMSGVIFLLVTVFLGIFGPVVDTPGAINTPDQKILTAVMTIIDHPFAKEGLRNTIWMTATFYFLLLLWKYRKQEPSLECFALLYLAHLPVLDYIGWHYTTPAWFVWSVYWMVVWKLVWLNIKAPPPLGGAHFFCYNNINDFQTA